MGHLFNVNSVPHGGARVKKEYLRLRRRLDQTAVGLPPSEEVYEILRILFTEEEARIGALMPHRLSPISTLSNITGIDEGRLKLIIERMADKGLVIDIFNESKGEWYYMLSPPVVGFFEFSLMRRRDDIPQKQLANLIYAYTRNHREFAEGVFGGDTQIGRTLVHENAIPEGDYSEVLSYEKASEIIRESKKGAVSLCFCRHEALHRDKPCRHPLEVCTSLNGGADYAIRHGLARLAEKEELIDILDMARSSGLVQICDNVKNRPTYICHCCSCCCGQLLAINTLGLKHAVKTSNFIASVDLSRCVGCGRCARACPVQAITLLAKPPSPGEKTKLYASIDGDICLGCGNCRDVCNKSAMKMGRRKQRVLTPENTLERILRMSIERGKLQHLIFDQNDGMTYSFLNRLLGAILRLASVKRSILNKGARSRFIQRVIDNIRKRERIDADELP